MFSKTATEKFTKSFSAETKKLSEMLKQADAVVIGAGAGLSVSAGFDYGGRRFADNFADFKKRYGFSDMYSGGFYPYSSLEEYWAFWSRNIYLNRYTAAPKAVYSDLFELVKNTDYFIITTNVDHMFQKSGFDKKRLFYTQGDYGLFQCSVPCCSQTFDNEQAVTKMVKRQHDMKIPSELVPVCPICGAPLTMNLRADDKFVEDEGWHRAAERYESFLRTRSNQKVLFLELGVGYNTPVIIKYPFWQMTAKNKNATYACVNYGDAVCPAEIEKQAICIDSDIGTVIDELIK